MTPEKAEIIGAIMGDKGTFKQLKRHGFYHGYDLSRYTRSVTSICSGLDKDWGSHLSDLFEASYDIRGSTYFDGRQWRFETTSTRAFLDLSEYYSPNWNCHLWRVTVPFFSSDEKTRRALVRGYFDADGGPLYNKARRRVSVKAVSVNYEGLASMKEILQTLCFRTGLYRRYSNADVWELCIERREDIFKFISEIGFAIVRKQKRLEALTASTNLGTS